MTPKELALQKLAQMKPEFAMRAQLQNQYNAEMANKYTRDIIPFSQWLAARTQNKADGGAVHNQDVMHLAIGGQGPKNWLKGSIDPVINPLKQNLMSGRDPAEALKELQEQYSPEEMQKLSENTRASVERSMQSVGRMHSMNQWVERNLANYIRKQMGTHEDPIRKLAEEGIVHIAPEQVGRNRHQAPSHRVKHGAEALGKSEEAKAWEDSSDVAMNPMKVGDILKDEGLRLTLGEPWMEKADPNTNIFKPTSNMTADALGFDHIVDVLKQDLAEGRIRPEQLNKISIEQAVRRTHEYNQEQAKKMREASIKNTEGMPVHKEYPEGYKWIELTSPKELPEGYSIGQAGSKYYVQDAQGKGYTLNANSPEEAKKAFYSDDRFNVLKNALKYEGDTMGHCVGGYCPDVAAGRSRIFSLRDAKGEPHVTVETKPKPHPISMSRRGDNFPSIEGVEYGNEYSVPSPYKPTRKQMEQIQTRAYDLWSIEGTGRARDVDNFYQQAANEILGLIPESIVQIKGKQNRAPKEEYLPYVQDFVRSGEWSNVGDLKNTGLTRKSDLIDKFSPDELDSIGVGEYLTKAEQDKLLLRALRPPEQNKAQGGIIHKALGGNVQPSLTQMKMALAQKGNSVNLKNVGANEAPNMLPKHYFPPDGNSNGSIPAPGGVATPNGMPIGGVDMSQQQGGHQLAPQQQAAQPPAQPPQGQPPQGQPDVQQGMAPAPQGAPMGNMLQMTPQGQTMAALGGGQPQKLAKGGSASDIGYLTSTPLKPNPLVGKRFKADPQGNLAQRKTFDIMKNEGKGSIVPIPYDATTRDRLVTEVSGHKLDTPLLTEAGFDYSLDPKHMAEEIGGASNAGIASRVQKRIDQAAKEHEGDVFLMPNTMGSDAENFSHHPAHIVLDLLKQSQLNKKTMKVLSDDLRNQFEVVKTPNGYVKTYPYKNFVGYHHPNLMEQVMKGGHGLETTAGNLRKKIMERLGQVNVQRLLDYNLGDLKASILDPDLATDPKSYMGHTVVRAKPGASLRPSKHSSYDTDYTGTNVGGMGSNRPLEIMMPDVYSDIQKELTARPAKTIKSDAQMRTQVVGALEKRKEKFAQPINARVINNAGLYEEGLKNGEFDPKNVDSVLAYFKRKGGYKQGGKVKPQRTVVLHNDLDTMRLEMTKKAK